MAKRIGTPLDMNNLEIQNLIIHILPSDPTGGDLVEGKIWYNSATQQLKYYDGASVQLIVNNTDLSSFITASSSDTLTNKTIDGDNNTIQNLSITIFKADAIETAVLAGSTSKVARADVIKAYIDNAIEGRKWGESCRVATTAAGTLSTDFANGQSVDGVTLATGDRILLKDQVDGTENGVYKVNASGAPTRDETETSLANHSFMILEGTTNGDTSWVCTNDSITYGTTSIAFNQNGSGAVPDATTSTKGKVELATPTETEAKSDATRAVTPSDLANFPIKKTFDIGDGSSTSFNCQHNLGTYDVEVTVYNNSSPRDDIIAGVERPDTNNVTIKISPAPTTNEFRVVVIG